MLEAVGLGRRSGHRWLLRDITLTVSPGERVALIGPSGSGKTLLLRSLAMLDASDEGEVRWQGSSVHGLGIPRFRSQAIYLHQRPVLSEGTVEANLRQPFNLQSHRHQKFDPARVIDWLNALGRNAEFLAKQQHELSGGESQLAALLRAIQLDPHMLLLDEPTAALDTAARESVESLIAVWLDQQPGERSIIWVTHDRSQADRVAATLLEIREGRSD